MSGAVNPFDVLDSSILVLGKPVARVQADPFTAVSAGTVLTTLCSTGAGNDVELPSWISRRYPFRETDPLSDPILMN